MRDKLAKASEQAAQDAAALLNRPALRNLIALACQQDDSDEADAGPSSSTEDAPADAD
jgi:hypothetical protein